MTTPADAPQPPPLRSPRLRARTVMIAAAVVMALIWLAVILVDRFDLGGTQETRSVHLFELLFTELHPERSVEWLQWLGLAALAIGGGYTAGRLTGGPLRQERVFWFLLAVAGGLMLIEDAGEVRNALSHRVSNALGDPEPFGITTTTFIEVPYFAALAAIPIYAVVRYGPVIWSYRPVRPYLVTGFVLYAIAAGGSSVRHVGRGDDLEGSLYARVGEQLNRLLGLEQLPESDLSEADFHYHLMDGVLEETLEVFAVAGLLAALLAFVATASHRSARGESGEQARGHEA